MRVAIINWSSRFVGGVEEYISILLPALVNLGTDVAFWYEVDQPDDRPGIEIPAGVSVFPAPDLGMQESLRRLRAWDPDVIYVQGIRDPDIEATLLEMAPAVFFVHSYAGTCISGSKTFTRPTVVACDRKFGWPCLLHYFPHGCGGRSPMTMWRQFERQSNQLGALRQYTSILTHTNHMQAEMARHGLHADVVPYPVGAQSMAEKQPGDGSWRLLYAARMVLLKGGRVLLDALPSVAAAAKRPVRLTLAGDGPERRALEARAHAITAPGVTTNFLGWVTQEYIRTTMQDIDLLVVPSLWPEPFGSVGPAAAQHGVPAAAFDVGGIRTWLADGISGHLAPGNPPTPEGLTRAIVRCLEDPQHYAALRDGAYEVAGRFTMAQHLPALIAHLERAAGR